MEFDALEDPEVMKTLLDSFFNGVPLEHVALFTCPSRQFTTLHAI